MVVGTKGILGHDGDHTGISGEGERGYTYYDERLSSGPFLEPSEAPSTSSLRGRTGGRGSIRVLMK